MVLGLEIEKELGDALYDELDVARSDYDTLPAYEFYSKVEKSCLELRPDIIRKIKDREDSKYLPFKTFDNEKQARSFLCKYAKEHFYLCIEILEDIFYNDWKYRVFTGGSFRLMKEIWLNRAKETGRESFLTLVKKGNGKKILYGNVTIDNLRAFACRFAPTYCFKYCLNKNILKRNGDGFYIEKEF